MAKIEFDLPTKPNCFLVAIAHSETDFALYLYWGIPDVVEQLAATLGSVVKRGEQWYMCNSDVAHDTLEQAGMALFERWKQPKERSNNGESRTNV